MQANFTIAEENYIKAIYHLQQTSDVVSTNALAQHIGAKPASVTDMMKKLQAKKLLNYSPYQGFNLSKEGNRIALTIVRRHRLWEYFLVDQLKFDWGEVHDIAEQLEHVSSSKLIDKLDAFLGNPQFDPHGDPIPDTKGKIATQQLISLAELQPATPAIVRTVTNQSNELLAYLTNLQIQIGSRLEVKQRLQFDKSVEIKIRNKQTTYLSEQAAACIMVNPL